MTNDFKLDDFQKAAIDFANQGNSVIVSAPTGAGKTLIAEHIIEKCMSRNKGVVYTAPIKALSNQKFRDFSQKYPEKTGLLTGDVSINPKAPIMIMTTEIFRNSILTEPERFKNREWVIFDEIHYLDDIERGTVWEETIILLPAHMRLLALSATLPNIDDFVYWLNSVHSFPIKKVIEKNRPVPLSFRYQCNNQIFNSFKSLSESGYVKKDRPIRGNYIKHTNTKRNRLYSLVQHLENRKIFPCVYFAFSRKRCEILADELYDFNLLSAEESDKISKIFDNLVKKFEIGDNPTLNVIAPLIQRGIAYHHAGLLPTLKEVIERLFATGLIKLIFTTETFALGINMPAKTVVFDSMSKYYGHGHRYLKTRDFYQMAGRSGRRGMDSEGCVYMKINPNHIESSNLRKIIYGRYEPITSQFRSCYATILNLYNTMGERLYDIYPKSFHFQQSNPIEKKEALSLLKRKITLLKSNNYILENGMSLKARLASKVYSFELQIGELFDIGFLDNLDELSLFIVICALVYEPRKGERLNPFSKKTKKIKRSLGNFMKPIHREERKFRIYPLSKNFHFNLSEAARAWYEGASFYKLNQFCSSDEGGIVRYFRMAIQVLKEMEGSKIVSPKLGSTILSCLKKINRDVIDAKQQLTQDI